MLKAARWGGLVLAVTVAPALHGQELAAVCQASRKATVGQWASYQINGGPHNGVTMRFAIVNTERRGDSTLYWFEVSTVSPNDASRSGVMQMLVPSFDVERSGIRGLVMKMGSQPALKMPDQMIGMMGQRMGNHNPGLDMSRRCLAAQVIGSETVSVPAGSFKALHLKGADGGEAWMSADIPFGLVKVLMKDASTMVLTGKGMDAKSSITETPQEMPMMPATPGMSR